ncbi:MAG TPA: hypothetical protein VM030_07665 [Acidimicrobiales bacterium]|nr:hypothetical protein [Acidimicrobiales bacterium]
MERALLAAALVAVAVAVAYVLERRRPDAPARDERLSLPAQIDRSDFDGADRQWLVAVFTSATCESCAAATAKARVVESATVAYAEIPWQTRRDLHDRYGIDTVPAILVADGDGVVRSSFIGTPTATDLWAAVAEARDGPGDAPLD